MPLLRDNLQQLQLQGTQQAIVAQGSPCCACPAGLLSPDLPPSSMVAGRRLPAAAAYTRRPVPTLPVKAIFATLGWALQLDEAGS